MCGDCGRIVEDAAEPTAEKLAEWIEMAAQSLSDYSADQWRRWRHTTKGQRFIHDAEAVLITILPDVLAYSEAQATARVREEIAGEIEAGPLRQGEGATRRTLAEYIRHGGEPRCGAVGRPTGTWSCVLHVGHDHRHWARDVSWSQ
jgi:hypothetical protein